MRLFLLVALAATGVGPSAGAEFEAGGGFADVTPRRTLPNYNGMHIPVSEKGGLQAHAVVISDGRTKVAIISVDATFMHREIVLRVREELRRRIGIDGDHVCVAATHSHATPATGPSFLAGASADPMYLDLLIEGIVRAADLANSRLEPVRLVAETLPVPGFVFSRRRLSPEGQVYFPQVAKAEWPAENPIDREMHFVAFENAGGDPIAFILAVPCHNNAATGRGYYHGDMFARAGVELRERFGEEVATVTLAAPCGDVAWMRPDGGRGIADDWAAGKEIAKGILGSYDGAERKDGGRLAVLSMLERMPDRPYEESTFCRDNCRGDSGRESVRKRYDPEEVAVRERGETFYNVEIQSIAFGPVAIVTSPAELFSIYGKRIKEGSPFELTMVSELSNGYCGYVPTVGAFEHGGYETHRTLYTSRLFKGAGDLIEKRSIEQLREAWKELNPGN